MTATRRHFLESLGWALPGLGLWTPNRTTSTWGSARIG